MKAAISPLSASTNMSGVNNKTEWLSKRFRIQKHRSRNKCATSTVKTEHPGCSKLTVKPM